MKILEKLGIKTENIELYKQAFTHTSFSNEHSDAESYERLEFLGDAVLELVISDYLYNERHLEEGTMTKMRASYVCEAACCAYAKDLGLDKEIFLGSGEASAGVTIVADVFESFIGAMYLDQGLDYAKVFVMRVIKPYLDQKIDFLHDYKSELQELVQTVRKSVVYEIIDEQGPAHDKTFTCQVLVDNIVMGTGIGSSKKAAEQEAARMALDKQVK